MRTAITTCLVLLSLGIAPIAEAISFKDGRTVAGRYLVSGSAAFANVKVRYGKSKARVSHFGQIRGTITKTVRVKGKRVSRTKVKIRGTVRSIKRFGASFSAPTIIRLSDGAVARGKFRGLLGKDRRLSRYFKGDLSGVSRGRLQLRIR